MSAENPQNPDVADGVDLDAVCRSVARLVALTAAPPRRLTFTAPGVSIELEWPDIGAPAPVAGAPPAPDTLDIMADAADNEHVITADMVGTFYRGPEPGAPPFAGEGDLVREGQQVGILEAMKLMTPVHTDRPGRVSRFLVADGQTVEYGTPLIGFTAGEG